MKAKTFNQFINERFEEMDRPNFFQRAKDSQDRIQIIKMRFID